MAALMAQYPHSHTIVEEDLRVRQPPLEEPDGTRLNFTVPDVYVFGSLSIYLNGLNQDGVLETSNTTFAFDAAPETDDIIRLEYKVTVI